MIPFVRRRRRITPFIAQTSHLALDNWMVWRLVAPVIIRHFPLARIRLNYMVASLISHHFLRFLHTLILVSRHRANHNWWLSVIADVIRSVGVMVTPIRNYINYGRFYMNLGHGWVYTVRHGAENALTQKTTSCDYNI